MMEVGIKTPKSVRPGYRRLWRAICLYGGIPYLTITLIFVMFQRQLIYRPTVAVDLSAATCGIAEDSASDVSMRANDGTVIRGWLLRRSGAGNAKFPLVLYFPGNAANRFERFDDLREFVAAGFDVLIYDYRGYGDSGGTPSQPTLESDAKQIWIFAQTELGYDQSRIVVFGESLGGAVAISLWFPSGDDTIHPEPAAVILNSTFTSMPDVAAWHYPWFPFRYLLLDQWPSVERIGKIASPIIVFHGTADEFVPFSHGQKLASHASDGRFITVPDGTHNSMPMGRIRHELQQIRDRLSPVGEPAQHSARPPGDPNLQDLP